MGKTCQPYFSKGALAVHWGLRSPVRFVFGPPHPLVQFNSVPDSTGRSAGPVCRRLRRGMFGSSAASVYTDGWEIFMFLVLNLGSFTCGSRRAYPWESPQRLRYRWSCLFLLHNSQQDFQSNSIVTFILVFEPTFLQNEFASNTVYRIVLVFFLWKACTTMEQDYHNKECGPVWPMHSQLQLTARCICNISPHFLAVLRQHYDQIFYSSHCQMLPDVTAIARCTFPISTVFLQLQ